MSPGSIILCVLLAVSIFSLLGSGDDYATDIPGLNPQVLSEWFPPGRTSVCNLSGFNITIKPRVPWRGSDVIFEWTRDTGCDLILTWIYDHSKIVTEWFKGNVVSGNKAIPCPYSPNATTVSVFAMNYISHGTNIEPSIESRHVPVKCYSSDDFYVEFDDFVPTNVLPTFVVRVKGTEEYLNENITLTWFWGDNSAEIYKFTKSTFNHNYNENGDFRATLTVNDKTSSKTINIVVHRGDLKYYVNTINGNISLTVFEFTVFYLDWQVPSKFSRNYDHAGAYTVTFRYRLNWPNLPEIIMIDNAPTGIQIIVDNQIESLVIETNNRIRYPPAQLTLSISVPSYHLPVYNMKCVLDMDDFINRKIYSVFSPKVTSDLKITFNYTYLTLGDHYIKVSCESFASRKETIQKITVYHDCLSPVGSFDFQYSGEETAMNINLNFETEIGSRKEVLYDKFPVYTWTIEKRLVNGSYSLIEEVKGKSANFPIKANTSREGLHRLNLKIEFPFSTCDCYQECTYINFIRVPIPLNAQGSIRIDCLYNCFQRVATRHILHVRLNCPLCTNLTWTLKTVNGTVDINPITHYGINKESLIIRGGSLQPGTNYTISVSLNNDKNRLVSYPFTTDVPPFGGTCEVNPSIGFASETLYTISCVGWRDDDPYPIYYQYIFQSGDRNNTEHILYAGYENKSFSMHLPVGDRSNDYRSHILVRITDGFGDYADYVLFVAIFPSQVVKDAQDAPDVNSSFTKVSSYLDALKKNITVANISGYIARSVRSIESAASNIALIPLPYQGISLEPDNLYLIGFYKNQNGIKVSFSWEAYWRDFTTPRDQRQKNSLTEMTSLMSEISLQLCHQVLNTRYAGTYTISSLASSMADLISGQDYVTENVLVLECADQLNANLVTIAATPEYNLQNHENITLAAGGMVRLVSKMLKVVYPTLTPYFPQDRIVKVMRNFLQYTQEFFDAEIYKDRKMLLQEQTFIAMKELLRIELDKEEKKRIALRVLQRWQNLLKGASYALDAISGIKQPEFLVSDGLTVMSSNHWIQDMQHEEIEVDNVRLNFSGSLPGINTDGAMNISLVVFRKNPYYWGLNGERISSRVIEYDFYPKEAFKSSTVRISLPNEGILQCKNTNYTDSEDNTTIKYLYYSFDRHSLEDDVLIFIKPSQRELVYDMYLKYGSRPKQLENNYYTSVKKSDWTKDGFRIIIRARDLPKKGAIYLAFVPHQANGTNTNWNEEDPPTVCLFVSSVHCYNWNGFDWDHRTCKVSEESSLLTSICLCETTGHNLTAGTTFYFPLNYQAFDIPNVKDLYSGTYLILVPFSFVIFLYVIILIWACLIYSVDENPWKFNFLSDGNESHKYFYLLRVYTGFGPKRGTNDNIYFELAGDINTTGVRRLADDTDKPHNSGSIRNYVVGVTRHLGYLMSLKIWLDHSGVRDGSWFLRKVIVDDVSTNKRTIFCCNKWLSFRKEDCEMERIVSSSVDDNVQSLSYRLSTNIPHYLAYINIWSSIFVRMHPSEFSRVGRVTGAFFLVTALMMTNLLLPQYVSLKEETKAVIVGPFRFSEKNVYTALISIGITVPAMYILFAVLHKCNLRIKCSPCRHLQQNILKFVCRDKLKCYLKSGDDLEGCIFVKKTLLPACCGALTWIVLLAIFCISVFYIIQITSRINKEDAETWLTTFLIALFVSILVFEPSMVLFLAILASLFGRLCDPRKPIVHISSLRAKNIWRCNFQTKCSGKGGFFLTTMTAIGFIIKNVVLIVKRLHKRSLRCNDGGKVQPNVPASRFRKTRRALRRLRRNLLYKSQTWILIAEMIAYSFFFIVAYVLALSSSDERAYELKNKLEQRLHFGKLEGKDFLKWMNSSFFDLYFPAKVFNATALPQELKYHFIDFANIRVGPARLRQVRSKMESCPDSLLRKKMCLGSYQITSEDTAKYYRGWNNIGNGRQQVEKLTFTEWHYVEASEIWGLPITGQYDRKLYGGGGYIVKLDINREVSEKIITELTDYNWIDNGTRAIFLEFSLYNPNVNIFSFVKYVSEYPEIGSVFNSSYITTFRLNYDSNLYIACYFIFIVFVILLFLRMCFEFYNSGTHYFTDLWNITDCIMLLLGISSVVLLFYNHTMTKETIERYLNDQNEYVNFEHLATANSLLITLLAILLFYATLRIIRIQGRSKWFSRAIRTLRKAKGDLLGFLLTLLIIYCAYVSLGYMLFGRMLNIYRDLFAALVTLTEPLLGKNKFQDIHTQFPILAEFYYTTFVFVVIFCLMTMATAILNESIQHVTSKPRRSSANALDDILYRQILKFRGWLVQPKKTKVATFIGGGFSDKSLKKS